jgi:hypothetical protein
MWSSVVLQIDADEKEEVYGEIVKGAVLVASRRHDILICRK